MNNLLLALEVIIDIYLVLYTWSTLMARNKMLNLFKCKSCGKTNTALHKKCDYCGKDIKQWTGVYVTFLRIRVKCLNKEGFADLSKAKKWVTLDLILETICILLVSFVLAINITNRL